MITYSFTDAGNTALYEHLYKCIKNDILNGALTAGEKLPSKRSFAKNLGISVITVETAYEMLASEGYIYSIPKRGFFVTDFNNNIIPVPAQKSNKNSYIIEKEPAQNCLVDFTSNQTPPSLFPFTVWAKLIREVLRGRQQELLVNSPCGGILELRRAIANHLRDFRGMQVSPEQIIVGAGTEYLYGLLIQLLGSDKQYAVENPGYRKISQIYKSHNVNCSFISMDESGVKIDELKKSKTDVIHISPSHHFPTGTVMPISRRYELLNWASESDSRYIIEDDYDSELRLSGQPISPLQSIDVSEKVIYMNTFTKTLASTIRISYMVLPPHLLKAYYENLSFYSCTVSNFEQYTLAEFIDGGHFEKHINRMRNFYHHKRDDVVNMINSSPLERYVKISKENAGLHFLMKIDINKPDEEFTRSLLKKGVKLAPLSAYFTGDENSSENIFVINYSSADNDKIEEALEKIYECCIE